ncbi:MAG: ATP synthase F1 subunit delta, partial [Ignavibacteria bacterium RBG_13_36_8]
MSEFNVTTRYAKALLELAEEKKKFEDISNDVELVCKAFSDSKELRTVMANPVIHKDKKSDALRTIFGKISSDVLNFLLFIVQKNREDCIFRILKRYMELRDIKLGIANANVTALYEFDEKQIYKLKSSLEKFTGKKIKINIKKSEE